MNGTEFVDLLRLAIGNGRTQNDFAKQAGISPEHLNRLLRNTINSKPSASTLRKISEASNGRVTLNRLEKACGMEPSRPAAPGDDLESVGEYYDAIDVIKEFKQGINDFSGKATRYDSIYDLLDTVEILYKKADFKYTVGDFKDFTGRGHAGAEKTVNITVRFAKDEYACEFGFVMFFCVTEKGGIIFSDAAFDLLTLNDFDHPVGGKKLIEISTQPNADRSKYQTVYVIEPIVDTPHS